jgi:hypothetical protein
MKRAARSGMRIVRRRMGACGMLVALASAGCGSHAARSASTSAGEVANVAAAASVDGGVLSCVQLVDCLNGASGDGDSQRCWAAASAGGRALLQTLVDCIRDACADAAPGADSGSGGCASTTQCNYCVQSGASPTGRDGGACIDDAPGVTPATDGKCGRCVDALLACH